MAARRATPRRRVGGFLLVLGGATGAIGVMWLIRGGSQPLLGLAAIAIGAVYIMVGLRWRTGN